jgi:hypothetical protein
MTLVKDQLALVKDLMTLVKDQLTLVLDQLALVKHQLTVSYASVFGLLSLFLGSTCLFLCQSLSSQLWWLYSKSAMWDFQPLKPFSAWHWLSWKFDFSYTLQKWFIDIHKQFVGILIGIALNL